MQPLVRLYEGYVVRENERVSLYARSVLGEPDWRAGARGALARRRTVAERREGTRTGLVSIDLSWALRYALISTRGGLRRFCQLQSFR